jgi:predicted acylesterase/phospholipase RssA
LGGQHANSSIERAAFGARFRCRRGGALVNDSASAIPERRCDIVMKGGITSGIVYPGAVAEISKMFRFVSIGGTSAGAIAACLTAAAEYRRITNHGDRAGFDRIAQVPADLGRDHALLRLFRPNRATAPVFEPVFAFLTAKTASERAKICLRIAFGPLRTATLIGTLPGLALGVAAIALQPSGSVVPGLLAALGLAAVGATVGAIKGAVDYALPALRQNGYGLCSGVDDADAQDRSALSTWLSALIDETAGKPKGEPLTFGDLWFAGHPEHQRHEHARRPDEPAINLQMVTTCVSHGRPYTFPTGGSTLFFEPDKMRRYLPEYVVEHMLEKARKRRVGNEWQTDTRFGTLRGMPLDHELPVILAARMSLAFPLLLSAVELHAIDRSRDAALADDGVDADEDASSDDVPAAVGSSTHVPAAADKSSEERHPEPCWFSDGGLSSNFPIHLFDGPLPRWPTFGLNLGSFDNEKRDYDANNQRNNVWMPQKNSQGLSERWSRFTGLTGFLGALFNAAKDWNDNLAMKMPGYRDRIATVKLRGVEGGLNLDMDGTLIAELAKRGSAAGQLLVERFAKPSTGEFVRGMDWENQRIVRFRATMASLQRYLHNFTRAYDTAVQPGDLTYGELLEKSSDAALPAYPWKSTATKTTAPLAVKTIASIAEEWDLKGTNFDERAPQPSPDLSNRARY